MGPKTYLMAFFLLVLFLDVQSCSSSSSRPAGAKFHAENNNGIWWPPGEDDSSPNTQTSSSKKARDKSSSNVGANANHHYPQYELPEISNDSSYDSAGVNGIIGNSGAVAGSNKHNGDSNNKEQPKITASRDPHQPNVNYYRKDSSSGTSGDGSSSSSELIESSTIIATVPVPDQRPSSNNNGGSYTSKSVISGSGHNRRLAKSTQGLGLVHFSNKSITCNDGSPAGYYIRKSSFPGNDDSNLWIIFLEGGWYCFDQRSCMNRWHRLNHLMSSSGWPSVKHVGGILSADLNENPYWWNANHIFIPYCSSDTWSGRVRGNEDGNPFSFMGALIIDEVVKSLVQTEGLNSDSSVILAGSSAGGTGVMINLDHVESLLNDEFGPIVQKRVKGITDSGWFIDKVPLYTEKANCHDVILCPPEVSLRKGMNLWNARLPESCQDSHPDEPWICFFGYRIYPTLKASLFVFQWLFDEAQMIVNNVPTPALRKEEWDYVYKVGDELKKTLMNVTNVFIPSCLAHTILTHRDWGRVEVNSVTLTRALKCWESGGIIEESNFIPKRKPSQNYWDDDSSHRQRGLFRHGKVYTSSTPSTSSISSSSSSDNFGPTVISNDSSRRNRRRHNRHRHNKQSSNNSSSSSHNLRQTRRRRKKLEKRQKLLQQQQKDSSRSRHPKSAKSEHRTRGEVVVVSAAAEDINANPVKVVSSTKRNADAPAPAHSTSLSESRSFPHSSSSGKKNKHKKRKRNRRWYSVCDATPGIYGGATNTEIRLIEKCSWPQCNKSCPKLLNPLTGEEVDFKDLLKSFGLDLATMAKALGIDLATLNSMDHQVLLQMLTQNA